MSAAFSIGQLRHLYAQMIDGLVLDTAEAARGLLGPTIEALERATTYRPPADGSHRSEMMPVECCYHCGGPIRVRGFAVDGCACEGRR